MGKNLWRAYLEKADDIVVLEDGGFGLLEINAIMDMTLADAAKAKVLFVRLNEHGDLLEEQEWSGLNFLERLPFFSITTTANEGFAWIAEHKSKGTWVHKFGPNEESVSMFPEDMVGLILTEPLITVLS